MNMLNIKEISFDNPINIYLSKNDYYELRKNIEFLEKKYSYQLNYFFDLKKKQYKSYNFNSMKKYIINSKKIIINIIKDAIFLYKDKLKNLECVFLTGSYARGTNKYTSDIDLHFFYKEPVTNFLYEEIVNYLVSKVLKKSRDSIDPTFILNFGDTKEKISEKIDGLNLKLYLISDNNKIEYNFVSGKKRRFYVQYLNSRNLIDLKEYVIRQVYLNNYEYNHCFEIIFGQHSFDIIYKEIYKAELSLVNSNYIIRKINLLLADLNLNRDIKSNTISSIKSVYQSQNFKTIYDYYSILRYELIYNNKKIYFFNLFEIMKSFKEKKNLFVEIYYYFWLVEKMANYCILQNREYSLHTNKTITYNFDDLNRQWNIVKKNIIIDLIERRKKYE